MEKIMTEEDKVKADELKAFHKLWGKKTKLSPTVSKLRSDVGKAPKCGVSQKKDTSTVILTGKKKK